MPSTRRKQTLAALLLVAGTSCTTRKQAETPIQTPQEPTVYRTVTEATSACLTALQQTLDKDTAEHGAPELRQLGQAVFQKPAWIINFEIKGGDPKRYLHCETKAGGGVSLSMTNELPSP